MKSFSNINKRLIRRKIRKPLSNKRKRGVFLCGNRNGKPEKRLKPSYFERLDLQEVVSFSSSDTLPSRTASGPSTVFQILAKKRIGDYEVLELLGKGSTGAVYSAINRRNGSAAVLKILLPRLLKKPGGSRTVPLRRQNRIANRPPQYRFRHGIR